MKTTLSFSLMARRFFATRTIGGLKMPNNYKHLYAQMKTMVEMYQDELVPGLRKKIEELEQNRVEVRCKDCISYGSDWRCALLDIVMAGNDFCSYGERRADG
jgi:hypothetical protein